MYPFPHPDLPPVPDSLDPTAEPPADLPGSQLTVGEALFQVFASDEGWILRTRLAGERPSLYGPCAGQARAEAWMHQLAAWWLWPRSQVRGVWGCLAQIDGAWFTALSHTALSPQVDTHSDVRTAEEHAARHMIAPAMWSGAEPDGLPTSVQKIETQFWVREGYRALATWATSALGALARDAYRSRELGRGDFPSGDLAERLGVSPATVSGAAVGRGWDPPINRARGVLAVQRQGRS
ncbi:hypothetical protein ACFC58_03295 [Kitasatospora purpeofusca]|uniref:hypothetical protein n=1 Tax=Kitasatospora purpeofusca TaxID=67352 RepID=UPI0035E1F072